MFRLSKKALSYGALALGAGVLVLSAPQAARAVAAAYVQVTTTTANPVPTAPAVPGNPFYALMTLSGTGAQSAGPGTGTLGVTEIVLTNTGSEVSQVNVFAALLSGGTCGGTNNVEAATNPFLILRVQPSSTLVVPLPTPLVFSGAEGYDNLPHTCVAASMPITGGSVYVGVNGFVN